MVESNLYSFSLVYDQDHNMNVAELVGEAITIFSDPARICEFGMPLFGMEVLNKFNRASNDKKSSCH